MISVEIKGKQLFVNGEPMIVFDERIVKTQLLSSNELIVLIDFPKRTKISENQILNLFKYDIQGNKIWQVKFEDIKRLSPVTDFRIDNDALLLTDFFGRSYHASVSNGHASLTGITK